MFHPNTANIGHADRYAEGWRGKHTPSVAEVAALTVQYVNSPCLWSKGIRGKKHFRIATWIGLDFDENVTIEQSLKRLKEEDYIYVLGTTRSHQKQKGDYPPCDRFRVFLRLKNSCLNKDDFELTSRELIKSWNSDTSCVDAGRLYWPLTKIISTKYYGACIPVLDSTQIDADLVNKYQRAYYKRIPCAVQNKLLFGVLGSRNTACWQISKDLAKLGWTRDEVYSLLMSSKIPKNISEKVQNEVRKTVRSGFESS